ncbi:MAG: diguanylate cyclase [Coleofasciculaceae cyanobacterium SM2_1_6]|nr:diguanylate cyclase [Coleofasciculaceae cyanobacterium SM2_1_6]
MNAHICPNCGYPLLCHVRHSLPYWYCLHCHQEVVYAVETEITEIKQVELALQESYQWFNSLIRASLEGIWVLNRSGETAFVNQQMTDLLGYTAEEMQGKPAWYFVEKVDRANFIQHLRNHQKDVAEQYEIKLQHRNGSSIWVTISGHGVYDRFGEYIGALGMVTDINDRKHSEERLRELKDTLQAIVQSSPLAIIALDHQGKVKLWNQSAEKMFGWGEAEVLGNSPPNSPDQPDQFSQLFQLLGGMPQESYLEDIETRYYRQDGSVVDISLSTAPLHDAEGRVVGNMGVAADITLVKKMQESLLQQAQRERLIAMIAQRIRQSLDVQEIIETTVVEVQQLLESDRVLIIHCLSPGQGSVVAQALAREEIPSMQGFMVTDSLLNVANYLYKHRQGEVLVINDVDRANISDQSRQLLEFFQVKSKLVVPILQPYPDRQSRSPYYISLDFPPDQAPEHPDYLNYRDNCHQEHYHHDHLHEDHPQPAQGDSETNFHHNSPPSTDPHQTNLKSNLSNLWGLLIVHQCQATRQWQNSEINLLKQLATQVGIALWQGQLYQQAKLQTVRERTLNRVSKAIRRTLDLKMIFSTAVWEIGNQLQSQRVEIWQYFPAQKVWINVSEYRSDLDAPVGLGTEISDRDNTVTAHLKELQIVKNRNLVPALEQRDLMDNEACLLVPLHFSDEVWGALALVMGAYVYDWQEEEIDFMLQIADQLAIAIQQSELYLQLQDANKKLQQLAATDGLTQIANRRYFDEILHQEWQRMKREQQPLSLIIVDIDWFKGYNDHYGHQAGDDCLRRVAQAIAKATKRPADTLARYGGEEFVILLPNTDTSGATQIAKQISQNVTDLEILHPKSSISPYLTVSAGITSLVPSIDTTPEQLLSQADQALYFAKNNGRNQFLIYSESVLPTNPKYAQNRKRTIA